jgi:hypothetical protein
LTSGFLLLNGIGMGFSGPITLTAVQNAFSRAELGVATASNMFFRFIGAAFGVALFGTVMNNRLKYWFPHYVHVKSLRLSATSIAYSPAAVQKLPAAVRDGVIEAFGHSLHVVFLVAGPIALIALPFALMMKEIPLRVSSNASKTMVVEGAEIADESELDERLLGEGDAAVSGRIGPATS